MSDLITVATATTGLTGLTAAQTAALSTVLPPLITAASGIVERWANRRFANAAYVPGVSTDATIDYIETLSAVQGRPERGEPSYLALTGFPVNTVARVATGRVAALQVANTDTSTNQRATAALVTSGDPDIGYTTTGLTLTRVASGVASTNTLTWASNVTVLAVANAINALGGGWTATLPTSSGTIPNYQLFASSELVEPFGSQACLVAGTGASFYLWGSDLDFQVDLKRGYVILSSLNSVGGWGSLDPIFGGFSDTVDTAFGGQFNTRYNAGWTVVPYPVQNAVMLLTQALYWDQQQSSVYSSEKIGDYQYTLNLIKELLPVGVVSSLIAYKNWRV